MQLRSKEKVLVVAPTHKEGDKVTYAIRENLRATGKIIGEDRGVFQHKNKQLTNADKSELFNYDEGDVVHFNQNIAGIKRGEKLTVVVDQGIPKLQRADNTLIDIPTNHANRFDVYGFDRVPSRKR